MANANPQAALDAATAAAAAATAALESASRGASRESGYSDKPGKFVPKNSQEADEAEWSDWKFVWTNWICSKDAAFAAEIQHICDHPEDVVSPAVGSPAYLRSINLYQSLSTLLKGKYLNVVKAVRGQNGFEAFRLVNRKLEPRGRNKALAILLSLMAVQQVPDHTDMTEVFTSLEAMFEDYKKANDDNELDENLKVATVVKIVPEMLKVHLNLKVKKDSTYDNLKDWIEDFGSAARQYNPTMNPVLAQHQG